MIWLCNGLATNRTKTHRIVEVVSLSDVSTQVMSSMGLQLAVLVIGLLAMVVRSTRAFGKPVFFIGGVGTVVTICLFAFVYFVLPFD